MTCHRSACLLLLLIIGTAFSVSATPIVSVVNMPTVSVGDEFDVTIMIEDAVGLNGFEFDLAFNESGSVVEAIDTGIGDFLLPPVIVVPDSVAPNQVDFGGATLCLVGPCAATGTGSLALFRFRAISPGFTNFTFTDLKLSGLFGSPIVDFQFASSRLVVTGPSQVPEPATGALLLMGLVALAGRIRRKRHS